MPPAFQDFEIMTGYQSPLLCARQDDLGFLITAVSAPLRQTLPRSGAVIGAQPPGYRAASRKGTRKKFARFRIIDMPGFYLK